MEVIIGTNITDVCACVCVYVMYVQCVYMCVASLLFVALQHAMIILKVILIWHIYISTVE